MKLTDPVPNASRVFMVLVALALTALGAYGAYGVGLSNRHAAEAATSWTHTDAVVTSLVTRRFEDCGSRYALLSQDRPVHHAVYQDQTGKEYPIDLGVSCGIANNYYEGQHVPILYNPEHPEQYVLRGFLDILVGLVGGPLIVVSIVLPGLVLVYFALFKYLRAQ